MEKFKITKEIIANATDYIPLDDKCTYAKAIAETCVRSVRISVLQAQADNTLAIPDLVETSIVLKKELLGRVFLHHYLHIKNVGDPFNAEDFVDADYDYYFSAHPFEQMERLKRDKEISDKVFDILADYGEFKKIVEEELYNAKYQRNDTLVRFLAGITVGTTPEFLEKAVKEMKDLADELTEKQKEVKKKSSKKQVADKPEEKKAE